MKKIIFLLCAVSIQGQSLDQRRGEALQPAGQREVIQLHSIDEKSSPLMILTKLGEKKATPAIEEKDPRRVTEGDTDESGTPITDNSSDEARGAFSGIAEEEREDGSLTLDHFRRALDEHPEARRFIINEDEENEHAISIQPREATGGRFGPSRVENIAIADVLRKILLEEHHGSTELVNTIINDNDSSLKIGGVDPLSAAKLGEILRRSDDIQKVLSRHIPGVETSPLDVVNDNYNSPPRQLKCSTFLLG